MDLPVPNQRAFLVLSNALDARHMTRVEGVDGPLVQVAVPPGDEVRRALEDRERVQLQYFDADGHVVVFTRVVSFAGNGRSVVLQPVESGRSQRREYLRWEVDLPIKLRTVEGSEATDGDEGGWWRARLIDLSGGGVAIRTGKPVQEDLPLSLQIRLPTGPIVAEGSVIAQRADGASFRIGIRFERITEAARSRIVRFVFQEELRFRRAMLDEEGTR